MHSARSGAQQPRDGPSRPLPARTSLNRPPHTHTQCATRPSQASPPPPRPPRPRPCTDADAGSAQPNAPNAGNGADDSGGGGGAGGSGASLATTRLGITLRGLRRLRATLRERFGLAFDDMSTAEVNEKARRERRGGGATWSGEAEGGLKGRWQG